MNAMKVISDTYATLNILYGNRKSWRTN